MVVMWLRWDLFFLYWMELLPMTHWCKCIIKALPFLFQRQEHFYYVLCTRCIWEFKYPRWLLYGLGLGVYSGKSKVGPKTWDWTEKMAKTVIEFELYGQNFVKITQRRGWIACSNCELASPSPRRSNCLVTCVCIASKRISQSYVTLHYGFIMTFCKIPSFI